MKPPIPVTDFAGSTRMMQSTGIAYISTPMIPLCSTDIGTSFCGSCISSAAPFCSSKPTRLKRRIGTSPKKTERVGPQLVRREPAAPCLIP